MRISFWFILTAILVIASAVIFFLGYSWYGAMASVGVIVTLCLTLRAVILPFRTIHTGMDLLRSQDFASSLRKVGQPDADSMVSLYNTLIANMKAERLRTEEQNNFLIKLVEASPMGIAICDFDGNIESSNEAFRRLASTDIIKALGQLGYDEQLIFRPSGAQVLKCSRKYFMDRGFMRPFFLIERLTDEIVKAETDVFHKIVRTMGHEVNNTLGGVISVLETVADIHAEDSDMTQVLESCRSSCLHLGEFVRGYSDVVKLPEPVLETLDLNVCLEDVLPFLQKMCPDNITVSIDACAEPAFARFDAMLLQRVIVNAVKNSVESIGSREGHIILRARPRSLEIIDDGPGISPEAAGHIFTPFFSTKQPDRGLGLMLISEILRRHEAEFSLASDGPATTLRINFK